MNSGNDFNQRRFSGAILSYDCMYFTNLKSEIYTSEGCDTTEHLLNFM